MSRTVLLLGGNGMFGPILAGALVRQGYAVAAPSSAEADVRNEDALRSTIAACKAGTVINLAHRDPSVSVVDPRAAWSVNADGAASAARASHDAGVQHIFLSTDYVFDGRAREPYSEATGPAPETVYGASKRAGELAVLSCGGRVIRTSGLFGTVDPQKRPDFPSRCWQRLGLDGTLMLDGRERFAPTYMPDLAANIASLLTREWPSRVLHIMSEGTATWSELAAAFLAVVRPESHIEYRPFTGWKRPQYTVLGSDYPAFSRGAASRHWLDGLHAWIAGTFLPAVEGTMAE